MDQMFMLEPLKRIMIECRPLLGIIQTNCNFIQMDGLLLLNLFVSCHFLLVTHVGRIFINLLFKILLVFSIWGLIQSVSLTFCFILVKHIFNLQMTWEVSLDSHPLCLGLWVCIFNIKCCGRSHLACALIMRVYFKLQMLWELSLTHQECISNL